MPRSPHGPAERHQTDRQRPAHREANPVGRVALEHGHTTPNDPAPTSPTPGASRAHLAVRKAHVGTTAESRDGAANSVTSAKAWLVPAATGRRRPEKDGLQDISYRASELSTVARFCWPTGDVGCGSHATLLRRPCQNTERS